MWETQASDRIIWAKLDAAGLALLRGVESTFAVAAFFGISSSAYPYPDTHQHSPLPRLLQDAGSFARLSI
jgi:hypothetical protein